MLADRIHHIIYIIIFLPFMNINKQHELYSLKDSIFACSIKHILSTFLIHSIHRGAYINAFFSVDIVGYFVYNMVLLVLGLWISYTQYRTTVKTGRCRMKPLGNTHGSVWQMGKAL